MPSASGCLTEIELQQLAEGGTASPQLQSHLDVCESCQARLRTASDEMSFMSRVRTLSAPTLAPSGAPRIPGYRVLDLISGGSQGLVYKAVQESTQRTVAIKTLPPGEVASSRQRLRAEREAEIAARLRHPNIVTIYESRTLADGRTAVIMEFVDGVPFDKWMPSSGSTVELQRDILRVFIDVCSGIHHAHLNGVIHRDLKPDNILVNAERRPVILDFGIARAGGVRTTATGEFAGTPAYASPEQVARRPDEVDALTDVYSLGVILYKILCHELPYELSGSIFDIARTIGEVAPTPPRTHNPSISPDLEAILDRALAKDKRRRYQSAASLGRDVERFLTGAPVEARSGSGWYLLRKAVIFNRARLAWASVAVLLLVGAIVAVILSLERASRANELASIRAEQARAQEVHARAVTELLREALPNADPEHPELAGVIGAGFGRLYFRLETGAFAEDPEVDQEIRRLWGHVYTGFGGAKAATLVEYAEVSLRLGLERLRAQRPVDWQSIAASQQELTGVLLVRRRAPEAEACARETLALWQKNPTLNARRIIETRALLARSLEARDDTEAAVAEADTTLAAIQSLGATEPDLITASMQSIKARIALRMSDTRAAEPLLRSSLITRLRLLPPQDPELIASLEDLRTLAAADPTCELVGIVARAWGEGQGELPQRIGRDIRKISSTDSGLWGDRSQVQGGRTRALGRLVNLQSALLGPRDPALVPILLAQFRAAVGEGLLRERADSVLRAADLLASAPKVNDAAVLLCTEEAAVSLAVSGQPEHAVDLGRRAKRIRTAAPEGVRDELMVASTTRRLGWFLLLAGKWEESEVELLAARKVFEERLGLKHHLIAIVDGNLALAALGRKDLARADALSRDAYALGAELKSTPLDQWYGLEFTRARVLTALAREEKNPEEAKAKYFQAAVIFDHCWDPFFRFSANAFEWRLIFVREMTECCRALGDPARVALWESRVKEEPMIQPNLPGIP